MTSMTCMNLNKAGYMRQTLETLEAEGPVLYYSAGFIRSVAKCDPRICWHCLLCHLGN